MVVYFIICYLIGSVMTGFLVVKMLSKEDIRLQGSGNVGARNAGRTLGKQGFVLTFLGDAAKGIIVITLARTLHYNEEIQLLGLAIAIIGHLKPIFLRFKGGKGISTFIGGIIVFEPFLIPILVIGFLIYYLFMKSFTFSGLGSFLLIPISLYYFQYSVQSCLITIGILIMLYIAHTDNIKERLKKYERKS